MQKIMNKEKYFAGFGYDCHKIVKNKKLFLGGVKISNTYGLKGHSDADVVLHSICDAVLSAAGFPDIGVIFPDSLKETKNMDSKKIVAHTLKLLHNKKFKIANIDVTVICDNPKISEYKDKIINMLKTLFNTNNVNIKGKTTEGIKCFKNYIQSFAVVLLKK